MQRILLSLALLLAVSLVGCTDEELFGACPFDNTILQNCDAGDGTGARFTCVVEAHPQCAEDICLSWKNSAPFCTRRCTPGGGECPASSKCATYNESQGKYFCVSDVTLAE
jgi:hypothetical protein